MVRVLNICVSPSRSRVPSLLLIAVLSLLGSIVANAQNPPKPPVEETPKCGVCPEMVEIPAGKFKMGSPFSERGRKEDEFQHQVTISKKFWMAEHELTQAQWVKIMKSNHQCRNLKVFKETLECSK